jgi:uncharacterized damage-inducible protein DinB
MAGSRVIVTAVENHFRRICDMWRDEIANIPEEEWRRGDIDYLIPARHLCHVVVTNEFYSGDASADGYDWRGGFQGDWEGMTPAELPDREESLRALDVMQATVAARLAAVDDEMLCAPETLMPWTGATLADRTLYWLRHFQHHLGELHAELRRRGIERAGWR